MRWKRTLVASLVALGVSAGPQDALAANVWGGANWGELVWGALQLPALQGVGLLALGALLMGLGGFLARRSAGIGASSCALSR